MAPTNSTRRKPHRRPPASTHSVRVPDEIWERARARAEAEGRAMNYVMGTFIEWYANGQIGFGEPRPRFAQFDTDSTAVTQ